MPNDILSYNYDELSEYVKNVLGEQAYRTKQIAGWLTLGVGFDEMSNLSQKLRDKLKETAELKYPRIKEKYVSKIDGTIKYLYSLCDGQYIESVLMKYEHGYSICLSTQAGCRMGCKFCASTIGGKVRNLEPSEILGQIIVAQKDSGVRVSNIVLMGIGEPLDNYDNVMKFLRLVNSENGLNIGYRHISLSTCGIADKIYDLSNENMQITLSISLHAWNDKLRSEIMPINNKYNLNTLLTACRDYFDKTGRRISFEYTLIMGKNDTEYDAGNLAFLLKKYLGKRPFHVNLIPVNNVNENNFNKGDEKSIKLFCATLEKFNVNATVRRTLGSDINASCGQLRHKADNEKQKTDNI